ncbi:hypothetical protein TEA_019816 [Camellia sinensis var. sinensis]|uniref:Lipoyl-binding domain-containing protein n=1 Tax=Camellia sinensis var. sinensis TaxID=542762 RepID=A0A4S4DSM5_CAMSN|nr:hypothetical protein TEA_019816 [Camellia sinensis var. sinensis]
MFQNFEDPNRHSIEVDNQVYFNNGENIEIDEREVTEITLIKKFKEDDEEVKQEKNVEVSQELLMTELSSIDYYDTTFGASTVKISNFNLGFERTKLGTSQALHGLRTRRPLQYQSLVISKQLGKALIGCRCSSKSESVTNLEDGSEEVKSSGSTSQLIPTSYEVTTFAYLTWMKILLAPLPWTADGPVEFLVTQMCDTTSIAELELKLDGFRLFVSRDLTGKSIPASPPISTPVSVSATVEAPHVNGSVSPPSLAISKLLSSSSRVQTLLDKAADEGLVIIQSPRVGYFRRSRTIKGKRAPLSCKEKQAVKEGQVLCYIEQLGGEIPVESDVSGEVIKILLEDGDPVGYGDAVITILPSFPGIKKLQ